MTCPNQPLHCDAYSRFGSAGEPLRWYISQPAKCGPLTAHFSRLPSEVRMNAPFFVPTSTRTPVMFQSSLWLGFVNKYASLSQALGGGPGRDPCGGTHHLCPTPAAVARPT